MNDKMIYILFRGMYSERSVEGVYDTRELAEAVIRLQFPKLRVDEWYRKSSDDEILREFQIEEYLLNASLGHEDMWEVRYDKNRNTWECWSTHFFQDDDVHAYSSGLYCVDVRAKTEEQALKTGTEKIMQFIAMEGM